MGKLLGAFIPSISDSKGTGILDDLGMEPNKFQAAEPASADLVAKRCWHSLKDGQRYRFICLGN